LDLSTAFKSCLVLLPRSRNRYLRLVLYETTGALNCDPYKQNILVDETVAFFKHLSDSQLPLRWGLAAVTDL